MKESEERRKDLETIRCLIKKKVHPDQYILIKAWILYSGGRLHHYNWGDDMNYYLTGMLSGKEVLPLPDSRILKRHPAESYLVIGSTVTFFSLDRVTIWGAGIINQHKIPRIQGTPKKICAVRGPLTRSVLLEKGYDCPEVYGDPILLMSGFYRPKTEVKYEYGVIPHYKDRNCPPVQELREKGIKIIDIRNYGKWQNFIDEICECRYILSSSLHGLITAESYGIPSVWAGFSDCPDGWDFKFRDYYQSIHKEGIEMIPVSKAEDLYSDSIQSMMHSWKKGAIDLDLLLSSCPFYHKNQQGEESSGTR